MDLFLIALLLLAVGGVVVVALGKVGGGLAPTSSDVRPPLEGRVSRPEDLDEARFAVALRGYRMDQVDAVLDEARELLALREAEIARLRLIVGAEAPEDEGEPGHRPAGDPDVDEDRPHEPAAAHPRPAP